MQLFLQVFYLQQRAGKPGRCGYSFRSRSSLGLLSTVKREHPRESPTRKLAVPAPSSLIVWAAGDAFVLGESSETPRKLLMGTGLDGERRRYLSPENQKSALGTFTQPHSISPEVGAGLSPPGVGRRQTAGAEQAGRGSGPFSKLGVTSFPPRGAQSSWLSSLLLAGLERSPCPTVCPNSVLLGLPGRKAMCFQREGEQALGFAYCSLSKDAIAVASAHHGGGSLVWDGRGWQGLAGQRGAPSPLTDQPAPLLPVC